VRQGPVLEFDEILREI
jgi:hypothetical protein